VCREVKGGREIKQPPPCRAIVHCGIKLRPSKIRTIEDPMATGTGLQDPWERVSETSSDDEDKIALKEIAHVTRLLREDVKDILS
jgi:hypothetical protein